MEAQTKAQQAALEERNCLSRVYRKQREADIAALLTGPHGVEARALIELLDSTDVDECALVAHVRSGPWCNAGADEDTRFLILAIIDRALIRARERRGLVPFDDPLGDESNAFLELREQLR
jgi:hypothetical protein